MLVSVVGRALMLVVCCSGMHGVAVFCNGPKWAAVCCSMLQYAVAVVCCTLQRTAAEFKNLPGAVIVRSILELEIGAWIPSWFSHGDLSQFTWITTKIRNRTVGICSRQIRDSESTLLVCKYVIVRPIFAQNTCVLPEILIRFHILLHIRYTLGCIHSVTRASSELTRMEEAVTFFGWNTSNLAHLRLSLTHKYCLVSYHRRVHLHSRY